MQLVDVKTILPSTAKSQQEQEIIVQNLLSSITPLEVISFLYKITIYYVLYFYILLMHHGLFLRNWSLALIQQFC